MSCCDQQIGLSGMLGALHPIHQEAHFALSVEMDVDCNSASGCIWTSSNERHIEAALNESDYTSGVSVYQLSGWANPYIVIEGYSALEYGSADHLKKAVIDTIKGLGYFINAGSVRFEADTYDPVTGQPTVSRSDTPTSGGANRAPGNPPKEPGCWDTSATWSDYVKCEFDWDVDPDTLAIAGISVGALAFILILGAIKR